MQNKKIAVFFDCENISATYVSSIFEELAKYGEVIIRQAFRDWGSSSNRLRNFSFYNSYFCVLFSVDRSLIAKRILNSFLFFYISIFYYFFFFKILFQNYILFF